MAVFEGDSVMGAITDQNGHYKLQVALGGVSVRVSFVRYNNAQVANVLVIAGKETELNFEMEEKVNQIAEVVVTDNRGKGEAKNEFATVSARSFDVEQTSRFSGDRDDPARMASNFAGVGAANDARNDIIIRGNSPLGLLWRFEGLDIPNPNHFGGFGSTGGPVSMLNNNTLAGGDFFTSAFPAEYGNAVSGVFDLNLRNGNADKYQFLAEIGFNGIEAAAEGPFDKKKSDASFLIDYRYSTLGFFKLIGVNFGTGSAVPQYQDLTFKINIPTKKAGVFRLFGFGGLDNISLLGSGDTSSGNLNSLYGSPDQDIFNKVQTGVVGFSHTYFFNSRSYYKLIVGASHQTQLANIDTLSYANPSETGETEKVKLRQNIYNLHILYNNKIDARNTVTTGVIVDVYDVNFTDSLIADSGFAPLKYGKGFSAMLQAYAMWQHKFTERLVLNVGFHAQYFTLSNSFAPEPRIGLKYQVAANQYISFGYGLHHELQPLPTYYNRDTAAGANFAETNLHMGFTRADGQGTFAHSDQAVLKDLQTLVLRGVIGGHERRAGDNFRDVRVIDLPASVIALTHDRVTDRVKQALLLTPRPAKKITRILFQEGWENGAGEKRGRNHIPVDRAGNAWHNLAHPARTLSIHSPPAAARLEKQLRQS